MRIFGLPLDFHSLARLRGVRNLKFVLGLERVPGLEAAVEATPGLEPNYLELAHGYFWGMHKGCSANVLLLYSMYFLAEPAM